MPREEFDKALKELQTIIETVQELVETMIIDSIKSLENRDLDLSNKVIDMDDEVDRLRDDLEQKAIFLIASEQPLATDLRKIITNSPVPKLNIKNPHLFYLKYFNK